MSNRIVRDELLTSERYWSISDGARVLFVSVLLSADDCGRANGSNFALRTKCLAGTRTPDEVEALLSECVRADLLRTYPQGDARYIFVPRFRQRLRYTNSRYPEPPKEINDVIEKKSDLGQTKDGPKTGLRQSQDGRSEEKRSYINKGLRACARETETRKTNGAHMPLKAKRSQWWTSPEGIDAKGVELGVSARAGESLADYKARLFDAINAKRN